MTTAINVASTAPNPVGSDLTWVNSFAALGPDFYTALQPSPLPAPYWVGRSRAMARELGLEDHWLESAEALAALTGNQPLAGARPLASVYSGHQFGHWAGATGRWPGDLAR